MCIFITKIITISKRTAHLTATNIKSNKHQLLFSVFWLKVCSDFQSQVNSSVRRILPTGGYWFTVFFNKFKEILHPRGRHGTVQPMRTLERRLTCTAMYSSESKLFTGKFQERNFSTATSASRHSGIFCCSLSSQKQIKHISIKKMFKMTLLHLVIVRQSGL